ncbi:MAG TPA: hypothetical protein VKW70_05225 [Terriglobia bacterium]|nr:hypothetical protein [Terriglobia bacterium]
MPARHENRLRWASILILILGAAPLAAQSQSPRPPGPPTGFQIPGITSPQPGSIPTLNLPSPSTDIGKPLSQKQKTDIVRANFQRTKKDIAKLSKLVQSLQDEIDKTNPNVLSLSIVNKATRIEKLAKRIKDEAKSY